VPVFQRHVLTHTRVRHHATTISFAIFAFAVFDACLLFECVGDFGQRWIRYCGRFWIGQRDGNGRSSQNGRESENVRQLHVRSSVDCPFDVASDDICSLGIYTMGEQWNIKLMKKLNSTK
jgi:hypothetical protein